MAAIDDALYEVDSSEFGPRIGAFFTNEGTLVRPSSGTVSPAAAGRQPYKHGTENDGVAEGLRHFLQHTAARIYPESRDLLEAHQRRGHTIVVCTSAPRYEVQPLADDLGVEHVLTQGPIFDSGPLAGPVPRGRGLTSGQLAVKEFAECFDIELDRSWAYASADGDLGLLEQVGHPCALNPTPGLRAAAAIRRWPTRCWPDTDHPGGVPVVRTIAALGSVIPSFLVAAPGGLLGGGRRAIFNRGMSLWGKLSTALAGVRLNVDGDENLWKQRPAVFIMNHQSGLDGLIGARLFEKDYTFVASARFRRNPIIGPVGWLADAAFVEGGNTAEAVRSLEAVTKVIEKGLSIVDRAGGHAVTHQAARTVQEGRLPHRDDGGRSHRPDRDSQCRRSHAGEVPGHPARDGGHTRSPSDPSRRLDARQPQREGRRGAAALPDDPRQLAAGGPPRPSVTDASPRSVR